MQKDAMMEIMIVSSLLGPEQLCSDLMPDSGQLQGGFPPHECVPTQEVWEHSGAGPGQGEGRPETGDGC